MVDFLNGIHGEHVARHVEEEHKPGPGNAIIHPPHLAVNPVLGTHFILENVTPMSARVSDFDVAFKLALIS